MRYLKSNIHYFLVVAEELHFRRASEKLHVAQPAISRAIQQLEDQLGLSLFDRSNRGVALTAAGQAFYAECQAAARIMENAKLKAIRSANGETGQLLIGYTDFAINGPLPRLLANFHHQHPDVTIDLVRKDSHTQLEELEQGKIDLGFLTGPIKSSSISHHIIHRASYVVVLPLDHELSKLDEISLEMLAEEEFVLGDNNTWRHFILQLNTYCIKAGFTPKISRQAPTTESIFGLVAAKMGITLYPDFDLNHNRKDIAIRPVKNSHAYMNLEAAWHKQASNPAVSLFLSANQIQLTA
ncbi:LysR family transcriptional regulator [Halomonas daqingensis]|uniref:LysR family transcriptional regulator n=1 Tax=Billgrantia desiderata TaxID=52021 RepID=A0ABS9B838_9GAMM|nr:LysR substrate-binding domain-containing protein [Halomonas desiderata]MCE8043495.1 LysR family transcriptional regulator [Halomonas desiderata]MCE8048069.1 LysR family transcriptional regulator [Halomonas desiderata]